MKVKITRNAAKQLTTIMEQEEDKDLKLRVYITHAHGDHAHYGLALDWIVNTKLDGFLKCLLFVNEWTQIPQCRVNSCFVKPLDVFF
ncbi:hypothetical protein P9302_23835 [Brevibacillus agri]|nr:hypothetical protein [Brevibacillus agri]